MEKVELALENLRQIRDDFKEFCEKFLYITEADTRINIIDRILKEVLFWPDAEVRREAHSENGFIDYILHVNGKKFVCVEAKKEGISFDFPKDKKRKYYQINGAISTEAPVNDAILQARKYCDDSAIRYAIVTNGYTWIVFRAIREDMSWKEGSSKVFHSINEIVSSFTEFWNLLSYDCINQGSLDTEFSNLSSSNRSLSRVLNFLLQPDVPLLRNPLHTELHSIIGHFFEDIADPNYIETLENCYVYSTSIKTVATDINYVIKDSLPNFLKDEGTLEIRHKENDSGVFGRIIEKAVLKTKGQLFLLLGGIGAGKTTFQKRYQLTVGKQVLNESAIWFAIDFLKPPTIDLIENFVWGKILNQLRERYQSPYLETRQNIKRAFATEIVALRETALYGLKEATPEYEKTLSQYLGVWQSDLSIYVPRLLSIAKPRKNLNVVLFFDNVDQLSPNYQAQIFLLAQRVTDLVKSITIIALREESYYTASVQKVFTAYINRKFHIASPPFRKMIGQRIKYAVNIIDERNIEASKFSDITELQHKQNISDFLKIVEHSIFEKNKNIARFIDHLCFGNMRNALQMFSTFLVSGATDVEKMIRIYRRDGNYYVAFHEFLRSIMLGERYYYKEAFSVVLNVFECGQERNSSHFTSLRILSILDIHRNESAKEGEGFYEINKVLALFEDVFNNKEDFLKSLNRLVNRQLVETNTKIFENISGSTHIRITSAGWYYFHHLITSFAYLDLVFQDTPIDDKRMVEALVASMNKVNNLSDPEEDKIARMDERFYRVGVFLNYLEEEELNERKKFLLENKEGPIFHELIINIRDSFERQKEYIMQRLQQNRERYEEEFSMIRDTSFMDLEDQDMLDDDGVKV